MWEGKNEVHLLHAILEELQDQTAILRSILKIEQKAPHAPAPLVKGVVILGAPVTQPGLPLTEGLVDLGTPVEQP